VDEPGSLGLRADQSEEAEVGALQDRLADAHVELVLVRQHEVERARRREPHLALDGVDADLADVIGPRQSRRVLEEVGRELAFALVDPVDEHVQRGERTHDRAADMPGAVELQMKARRVDGPAFELGGVECREAQRHRAAAALPEGRAERVVALVRLETLVGEHRARFVDRLQLQVPTADRAGRVLQAHEHARAGFARRRAARFADFDQHRAAAGELPAGGHCTQA